MPQRSEDEAVATDAVDERRLLAENASLRDQLLRALAEAENTRLRAERTAAAARKFAVADFARELLAVVDNLQRMIDAAAAGEAKADPALVEGARATLRMFLQTLDRFGVKQIDALGQRFDPNLHDAIRQVDGSTAGPAIVTQVLEPGYTMYERLLRPARVVVSNSRKGEPAEGSD